MIRGRSLHRQRDTQNGFPSHFARNAAQEALKAGCIDFNEFHNDCRIFSLANVGKHGLDLRRSRHSAPKRLRLAELLGEPAPRGMNIEAAPFTPGPRLKRLRTPSLSPPRPTRKTARAPGPVDALPDPPVVSVERVKISVEDSEPSSDVGDSFSLDEALQRSVEQAAANVDIRLQQFGAHILSMLSADAPARDTHVASQPACSGVNTDAYYSAQEDHGRNAAGCMKEKERLASMGLRRCGLCLLGDPFLNGNDCPYCGATAAPDVGCEKKEINVLLSDRCPKKKKPIYI